VKYVTSLHAVNTNSSEEPNIISDKLGEDELDSAYSTHGKEEKCKQDFGGKPKGKRKLERPRCRWGNDTEMDLGGMEWGLRTGFIWLRIGTSGRL
jgi:hypothetical protein